MMMPLGTYTIAMRTGALGAADIAGAMASRNGSATAAPMPCRNVRRPSALRSMGSSRGLLPFAGRSFYAQLSFYPVSVPDWPACRHGFCRTGGFAAGLVEWGLWTIA